MPHFVNGFFKVLFCLQAVLTFGGRARASKVTEDAFLDCAEDLFGNTEANQNAKELIGPLIRFIET